MDLEMVSKEGDYPSEPPVKVSSRSIGRNCVKTPPILQVTSWRTWRFLMDMEMVSKEREYPSEPSVKVSSRSIVRNCVKNPPILQVTSWSLGGQGGS